MSAEEKPWRHFASAKPLPSGGLPLKRAGKFTGAWLTLRMRMCEMPQLIRLLFIASLFSGLTLLLAAFIPGEDGQGHQHTFREHWTSLSMAPSFLLGATILLCIAWGTYRRIGWLRFPFLLWPLAAIGDSFRSPEITPSILLIGVILLFIWYLFFKENVVRYFSRSPEKTSV